MSFIRDIYYKSLEENERQRQFWENYLNNLRCLDFHVFGEKLKVPALVPLGSRILFRGKLIHTNEITVALGADYFAKCSIKQAEILKQHRISVAESKLSAVLKEREYLEGQLEFNCQPQGQEIVEQYNEEDDKIWRHKHRENIRNYKQSNKSKDIPENNAISDEELWDRLDELEIQEELEEEYAKTSTNDKLGYDQAIKEKDDILNKLNNNDNSISPNKIINNKNNDYSINPNNIINNKNTQSIENKDSEIDNVELKSILSKAIDKQNEIEAKLFELKNRKREGSQSEQDLISRLDELDELDELEDEVDRLDDFFYKEDEDEEEIIEELPKKLEHNKQKSRITFQDDCEDSNTIQLSFTHTDVVPNQNPYDPDKGIVKPSDIYKAFALNNNKKSGSILKETKYPITSKEYPKTDKLKVLSPQVSTREHIGLEDIAETSNKSNVSEEPIRPMSLFKMRRMEKK